MVILTPDMVLGPQRKGIKLTYTTDTRPTDSIRENAKDSDLFITLSWQKDAKPVHWECDGGTEYDMQDGTRTEVGTCITLFLNEDCLQFCNEYKATEVIKKYCSFMPVEIYVS